MSPRNPILCLLLSLVLFSPIFLCVTIEAKHIGHHRRHKRDSKHSTKKGTKIRRGSNPPAHSPLLPPLTPPCSHSPYEPYSHQVFDIRCFGAEGDGVADDTKALLAAWNAACSAGSSVVEIPSELIFLIRPVTLKGPCLPDIVLQIDGVISAPSDLSNWPSTALLQWINLLWVHDFTIRGSGTVNGRGTSWWENPDDEYLQFTSSRSKIVPDTKPTAIRFYGSHNVTVKDISIFNSPQCHLKFDNSSRIRVLNLTITSPGNSPNTDGIHLQNSNDVEVMNSTIACGDDCISIQTGCSNVYVHRIRCGPGHGISLGSLGRDNSVACVNNITVRNITIQDALSGVRIKTWQGGKGLVSGVTFSEITVSNVATPIVIDQFYCDRRDCRNSTDAVAVSGVTFSGIKGTYSWQPVYLACSDARPCMAVKLMDVELSAATANLVPMWGPPASSFRQPLCWNAYGESEAPLLPRAIDCLRRANLLSPAAFLDSQTSNQCLAF